MGTASKGSAHNLFNFGGLGAIWWFRLRVTAPREQRKSPHSTGDRVGLEQFLDKQRTGRD